MRQSGKRLSALLLALALLLGCAACGGREYTAATMHLVRTEGTVQVADDKGKLVLPLKNLGLFSGYALATLTDSYGWISLDDARLAKLDENSGVQIHKAGRLLELNVVVGGLFFNVTKPLEEDEEMNIRTSSMVVGIRGTSGWVEVENENLMRVFLLRGTVECSVLDEDGGVLTSETITAGQRAELALADGEATITVEQFDTARLPAFVQEALDHPEKWDPDAGEADDGSASGPSSPGGDTQPGTTAELLAPYVGTYTPYPYHSELYGGKTKGLLDLQVNADGSITGGWGGRNGDQFPDIVQGEPDSVTQKSDGAIELVYGYATVTVYPPNVTIPKHNITSPDRVYINYVNGEMTNVLYYADPASLDEGARPQMTPEVGAALEQYRNIIRAPENYDYQSFGQISGYYRYALAQMQTEYAVPALLVEQGSDALSNCVLVFQYVPETRSILVAEDVLMTNDRVSHSLAGDGNGLFAFTDTPGTLYGNAGIAVRYSLRGSSIVQEEVWRNSGSDPTPPPDPRDEIGELPMQWYNTEDPTGLDSWSPYATP